MSRHDACFLLICLSLLATPLRTHAAPRAKPHAIAPALSKARQAEMRAELAKTAYVQGAYAEALEAYREALALDPGRAVYAYGIAISAEAIGDMVTARTAYQQFLSLAPSSHALAKEAREGLARLDAPAPRPPVAPEPQPQVPVATPEPAAPATPVAQTPVPVAAHVQAPRPVLPDPIVVKPARPPAPWPTRISFGIAGAFAIAGAAFALAALATDADADKYRHVGSAAFDPSKISESGARERVRTINGRWTYAAVFGGCALATGGVGTWLHLRQPSVATDGRSVVVAWQF